MKKCVFSGTFDPPTTGHESIIENCLKIFDEVVVAVMVNPDKRPFITEADRLKLLQKLYADEPRVRVINFHGAAADLLEKEQTPFYVRGVRDGIDLDYENRNFFATKKLKNDCVTLYIPAEQEKLHVSSTLVRNSAAFEKEYLQYIPAPIQKDLLSILRSR